MKGQGSVLGKLRFFITLFFLAATAIALAAGIEIVTKTPSTYVYPTSGFLPFNIHRGTQTMLTLMVPGATFDDPKGVACALLKSGHHEGSPMDDVVITVIGVNSGAGEIVYNVGLRDLRRFGSTGAGDKQFMAPTGVAIDPDGDVAVADTGNDRIALLHHDGLRIKWVKAVGLKGKRAGDFNAPQGVAYDSQGNLYIADTGNNRIQVMDAKGRFRVLKTPPLDGPSAIAAIDAKEAWTFYQQGPYANRLAVIDRQGQRILTLTLDGDILSSLTSERFPDPPVQLWGCAFDYYGNVIATDYAKSCLRKFDKDLRYVVTFGSEGTDDFQFTQPRGIAFNHQFGQLLVAEKDSVQYFWNGADAVDLQAQPEGPKIKVGFQLTERALVSAEVQDASGKTVATLTANQDLEQGHQELDWTPAPTLKRGDYSLKMRVMATYSTRERIAKEITFPLSY